MKNKGFSLVELLLALFIFFCSISLTIPILCGINQLNRNDDHIKINSLFTQMEIAYKFSNDTPVVTDHTIELLFQNVKYKYYVKSNNLNVEIAGTRYIWLFGVEELSFEQINEIMIKVIIIKGGKTYQSYLYKPK